jgi:hypothetical protein
MRKRMEETVNKERLRQPAILSKYRATQNPDRLRRRWVLRNLFDHPSAATAAPHEKHISEAEDPELFRYYFDALVTSILRETV